MMDVTRILQIILFVIVSDVCIGIAVWFCLDSNGIVKCLGKIRARRRMKIGRKRIQTLKTHREALSEAGISGKLKSLEELLKKILDKAEQDPDAQETVERLIDDYLPTLIELVESYEKLDRRTLQESDVRTARQELEETLTRTQRAFENLLGNLNRKPTADLSKKVCMLKRMIESDGLLEEDPAENTDKNNHTGISGREEKKEWAEED